MIHVSKIKWFGGHRLHATFSDAYFARVFLEDGAPTSPNGFDMCPDWLRQEIGATGASGRDTAIWTRRTAASGIS
jgi:hypothetical protein